MTGPAHVVLVGLMGAGKSSVGRLLATALETSFVDTDEVLEARGGATVAELFARDGEEGFRALELEVLDEVLRDPSGAVVATGGGVVTTPAGRALLGRESAVVFLDVSAAVAAARVGDARTRPLLAGDPRGTLKALAAERRAHYVEVADIVVGVDDRPPGAVVGAILEALGRTP